MLLCLLCRLCVCHSGYERILLLHTHTLFNCPFSGTTRVSRYQKGKTNLDFTEARDSEWQWHQLGRMQVCTSLQPDNHTSTPPLTFLQAGRPSCRPTNSVKALKAKILLLLLGTKRNTANRVRRMSRECRRRKCRGVVGWSRRQAGWG